jgi:hypothetical protein
MRSKSVSGRESVAAAACTPGSAFNRSTICSMKLIFLGRGSSLRQSYLERQDVIGPEAGIDLGQPRKALEQQPGTDEQHQRQRHFRHDQRVTEPVRCPPISPRPSCLSAAFTSARDA